MPRRIFVIHGKRVNHQPCRSLEVGFNPVGDCEGFNASVEEETNCKRGEKRKSALEAEPGDVTELLQCRDDT